MKRNLYVTLALFAGMFSFSATEAQNWSLAGNADASAASKLGTTTNVPLRLLTNNAERLRITPDGRLGIGTTTPSGRFTIVGSGTPAGSWVSAGVPLISVLAEGDPGNGDLIMAMASANPNGRTNLLYRRSRGTLAAPTAVAAGDFIGSFFASGYDGTAFRNAASIDFKVDAAATSGNVPTALVLSTGTNPSTRDPRLSIASNGNMMFNASQMFLNNANGYVGIGNSTPASRLDIVGGNWDVLNTEGDLRVGNNTYRLKFGVATGGLGAGDARIRAVGGTSRIIIGMKDALTIDSTGSVGVGTIAPGSRLDVRRNDGNFMLARFANTATSGDRTALIDIQNGNSTPTIWRFGVGGTGNGLGITAGQFYIERAGIGSAFNIAANGNVGIGTLAPAYRLSVNGVIQAKEVRVESGWADYVFEKGYRLMPLSEVAAYINQHQHLPGIASAKEVQENGLAVADMQTKMMEKIEELTLYVIELQQQIDELKKKQKKQR